MYLTQLKKLEKTIGEINRITIAMEALDPESDSAVEISNNYEKSQGILYKDVEALKKVLGIVPPEFVLTLNLEEISWISEDINSRIKEMQQEKNDDCADYYKLCMVRHKIIAAELVQEWTTKRAAEQ